MLRYIIRRLLGVSFPRWRGSVALFISQKHKAPAISLVPERDDEPNRIAERGKGQWVGKPLPVRTRYMKNRLRGTWNVVIPGCCRALHRTACLTLSWMIAAMIIGTTLAWVSLLRTVNTLISLFDNVARGLALLGFHQLDFLVRD